MRSTSFGSGSVASAGTKDDEAGRRPGATTDDHDDDDEEEEAARDAKPPARPNRNEGAEPSVMTTSWASIVTASGGGECCF